MKHILIIDDDPTLGHLLKTLLEMDGYHVNILDRGDESSLQAEIKAQKPDLLLLDVHLKNANGVNLLRNLRRDSNLNQTRIIMLSGMDVSDQCLKAGADAFLMKPYMPDELIALIQQFDTDEPSA